MSERGNQSMKMYIATGLSYKKKNVLEFLTQAVRSLETCPYY